MSTSDTTQQTDDQKSGSEKSEASSDAAKVDTAPQNLQQAPVSKSGFGRLINGQTAIDFVGRRRFGFALSGILIVITIVSLFTQGLNLGIDFEGGVSWEVPATNGFNETTAETVLTDNGIPTDGARIQKRTVVAADSAENHEFIKVQASNQSVEVGDELRPKFAEAAGVDVNDVNVNLVSSSWGQDITNKAVRALIIFLLVVSVFISIRFEWRMALAAILAMIHDILISVGIYSVFQFSVTPATVIAFLTILGYSLYDTIVVFDRVRENEVRFATKRVNYDDIINMSMNQVLMRSLTTSYSSIVPVIALLVIGTGFMGVTSLSEFAIALLVGMITGAYSSIIVASPLLGLFKSKEPQWAAKASIPRSTGSTLRGLVVSGTVPARRRDASASDSGSDATGGDKDDALSMPDLTVQEVLQHEPRPRKKTRR